MRKDKNRAFELRKQGKTYREIQTVLAVPKSTLSEWFKNEEWSDNIKKSNNKINKQRTLERLSKMHKTRRLMLYKKYSDAENEAEKEFEIYKSDPLFMAGLMIYAGEGDKVNKHLTRISNSDFYLHRIYIAFLEKFLKVKKQDIKIGLIVYPDNDIKYCMKKWSEELNISIENFHKPQLINVREKRRKLQYGIGMSIISRTIHKKKVIKWLELCKSYI